MAEARDPQGGSWHLSRDPDTRGDKQWGRCNPENIQTHGRQILMRKQVGDRREKLQGGHGMHRASEGDRCEVRLDK